MSRQLLHTLRNTTSKPLPPIFPTQHRRIKRPRPLSTMSTAPHPLHTPTHWVLDWDGTLTKRDTLNALVHIAAATKAHDPVLNRWKSVVDAYMEDYTSTLETLAPNGSLPEEVEQERQLLENMRAVELRSLSRVCDAHIFAGVTREAIEAGAKKAIENGDVALRSGVVDFIKKVQDNGDQVHILSVNWSRHFIHSCLAASSIPFNPSRIHANGLQGIDDGTPSTGLISGKIVGSGDKLRMLQRWRSEGSVPIVYVGDSWTDIECLLIADIGICIVDHPMGSGQRKLAEALERLDVSSGPLLGVGYEGDVKLARDFVAIGEWNNR